MISLFLFLYGTCLPNFSRLSLFAQPFYEPTQSFSILCFLHFTIIEFSCSQESCHLSITFLLQLTYGKTHLPYLNLREINENYLSQMFSFATKLSPWSQSSRVLPQSVASSPSVHSQNCYWIFLLAFFGAEAEYFLSNKVIQFYSVCEQIQYLKDQLEKFLLQNG